MYVKIIPKKNECCYNVTYFFLQNDIFFFIFKSVRFKYTSFCLILFCT